MKKHPMIFVSLALLSLAACVTDFTPEVEGVSGILVVDGTITDGESVFRLSRSVSILDTTRVGDWIALLSGRMARHSLPPMRAMVSIGSRRAISIPLPDIALTSPLMARIISPHS